MSLLILPECYNQRDKSYKMFVQQHEISSPSRPPLVYPIRELGGTLCEENTEEVWGKILWAVFQQSLGIIGCLLMGVRPYLSVPHSVTIATRKQGAAVCHAENKESFAHTFFNVQLRWGKAHSGQKSVGETEVARLAPSLQCKLALFAACSMARER